MKHGISQTGAPIIIVSQELLPKLEAALPSLSNVETIVVMEEPWNGPLDWSYGNINVYSFKSIIQKGSKSDVEPTPPSQKDYNYLMYTRKVLVRGK